MNKLYRVIPEKTEDHWLEVESIDRFQHVVLRFDGCIHFRNYSNGYQWDHICEEDCQCLEEYMHICDIDDMIKRLQELKTTGVKHFNNEFWEDSK